MKRLIKYDSIEKLINVLYTLKREVTYTGRDEDNEPMYDENIPLPIVELELWEKAHGTNAGVCFSNSLGFWVQSKTVILTDKNDNKATAKMAYENEEQWMIIIQKLAEEHNINLDENIISVFFEQSGKGVQTNSALSGMDKLAIIFAHFKVSPLIPSYDNNHEETGTKWLNTVSAAINVSSNNARIFNIRDFKNHKMTIDFNNPSELEDKVNKMVLGIEKNSPLGEQLGTTGNVGEGYVLTFEFNGTMYKFKIKGTEHGKKSGGEKVELTPEEVAESKVKVDFVNNQACLEWRLDQIFKETFPDGKGEKRYIGNYLKALFEDIKKEETIALSEIGLVPDDISKLISNVGQKYIISRINNQKD